MKKTLTILSIAVLAVVGVYVSVSKALVTSQGIGSVYGSYTQYDFFASTTNSSVLATTTSATSTNITPYFDSNGRYDAGWMNVLGAKRVTLYFDRSGTAANAGSSTFSIQVTPDGTSWYNYNTLQQNLATSSYPITISSVTETGTTTTITAMDLYNTFLGIRCIALVATDGSNRCRATASY